MENSIHGKKACSNGSECIGRRCIQCYGINLGKVFLGAFFVFFGLVYLAQESGFMPVMFSWSASILWPLCIIVLGLSLVRTKGIVGGIFGTLVSLVVLAVVSLVVMFGSLHNSGVITMSDTFYSSFGGGMNGPRMMGYRFENFSADEAGNFDTGVFSHEGVLSGPKSGAWTLDYVDANDTAQNIVLRMMPMSMCGDDVEMGYCRSYNLKDGDVVGVYGSKTNGGVDVLNVSVIR
jgi:energy-converting hydrogenase Eha subunit A